MMNIYGSCCILYIVGEHIDYCGYGVLPMAVEQDIIIATAVTADKKVILHNMDDNFK